MRRVMTAIVLMAMMICQAQSLEQTAGIYYAYPGPQSVQTPAPAGYLPFYISHYGRHGSRWVTDDKRYTDVSDLMADTSRLTDLGRDVYRRLLVINDDAIGRSGSLSPLGQRQHHDIAARMISDYPQVFVDTAHVDAVSSTSLRCAMSMSYFTEALKEINPKLQVSRTAYDKDMSYIAHTTPEGKAFSADTAQWRHTYWDYVADIVNPDRLIASLFINPEDLDVKQQMQLATGLYWIASDMQDVDLDISLYDIFTYDELQSYWRCINARMYICNGDSPLADGIMVHCADNLLRDIVSKADLAIAAQAPAANLRFGHDTHLLRLLALMGIEGTTGRTSDITRIHEIWRDYTLSPMAANLQMIFYHNDAGNVKVKLLLNENEVTLPQSGMTGPYYDWQQLRKYLTDRLAE